MRDLVPFVQFKKREKYPCTRATLPKFRDVARREHFYGIFFNIYTNLIILTHHSPSVFPQISRTRKLGENTVFYAVTVNNYLSANFTKMVKHTQTIRWQVANKLFECV